MEKSAVEVAQLCPVRNLIAMCAQIVTKGLERLLQKHSLNSYSLLLKAAVRFGDRNGGLFVLSKQSEDLSSRPQQQMYWCGTEK